MITIKELNPLMGLTFRHKTTAEEVKFIDYTLTGDMIKIITTGKPIKSSVYDIKVEIEKWEVLETQQVEVIPNTKRQNQIAMVVANEQNINKLKDILLADIEKVRGSREYVNQAKASIDGVKAFIELAKVEILIKKEI